VSEIVNDIHKQTWVQEVSVDAVAEIDRAIGGIEDVIGQLELDGSASDGEEIRNRIVTDFKYIEGYIDDIEKSVANLFEKENGEIEPSKSEEISSQL
jgi:hypothetical protein